MSQMSKQLGEMGEDIVAAFLRQKGYEILQTNYRNRVGEIDIIAQENDEICFIEVKTRSSDELGDGLEAITSFKKRQIIRVAQTYLIEKDLDDVNARFDVVAVSGNLQVDPAIEIIKNAFELHE